MRSSSERLSRIFFALFAGVLVSVTLVGKTETAAGAAPQGPWLPFTRLSDNQRGSASPQLAIAKDGTATAVWYRSNGLLQTTTRPPGGSFGAATDLVGSGSEAAMPQLAIAPDGTATIVWRRVTDANEFIISAAIRPPGGSFGTPVDISAPAVRSGGFDILDGLHIAVANDGTTTVVWLRRDDSSNRIVEATTRNPGGSFSTPLNISVAGLIGEPQIEVADDGTTTVVWSRRDNAPDSLTVVQAATRLPNGSFSAPIDISPPTGEVLGSPNIAAADDGTTTVVWSRKDYDVPGSPPSAIQAATRPPGGSFSTPIELPGSRPEGGVPRLAIAPDGTATVVWGWSDGSSTYAIKAADRSPGGNFGNPVNISTPGQFFGGPKIMVAADGTTTVISSRTDGPNTVYAAKRPPGGTFGPQVNISGSGTGADAGPYELAIAPDGVATVVWYRRNASSPFDTRIETASTQIPQFSLSVNKGGSGSGSVVSNPGGIDCGTDCTGDFTSYAQVTLNATPGPDSRFTGWSGAGCSGTGACQVKIGSDIQATATFEAVTTPPILEAQINQVTVKGPAKVKKGKKATYFVRISNSGNAAATGVSLKVRGRGVSFNTSVGTISASATKAVKLKLKPKKLGKVKALFKVSSVNAGGKVAQKKIKVRK